MKIFAYVGSERGKNSITLKSVNKIIDGIKEKIQDEEIKLSVYSEDNITIKDCKGCCGCFYRGQCHLDDEDDMKQIRKDMLAADLVILGTPVFLHHINGQTKRFLDRISYWAHIFGLIGKLGLSVSVSSTNGNEFVDFYLDKALSMMGVAVVENVGLPVDLLSDEEVNQKLNKVVEIVADVYRDKSKIKITQKQEFLFLTLKDRYMNDPSESCEALHWRDQAFFEKATYKELFFTYA